MIPILLAVLVCTPIQVDSLLSQYGPYSRFTVDTVAQTWWKDVLVLNYFPGSSVMSPNADDMPSFRIALDTARRLYRFFGGEYNDVSEFLEDHPVQVEQADVRPVGRFFLNVTQFLESDSIYSVDATEEFLEINRRLMEEGTTKPRVPWDSARMAIVRLLAGRDLDEMSYDDSSKSWTTGYYLWREGNGNLEYFQLRVSRTGRCEILKHEVLATKLGYYHWLKK